MFVLYWGDYGLARFRPLREGGGWEGGSLGGGDDGRGGGMEVGCEVEKGRMRGNVSNVCDVNLSV